jgi:hypothetical protein
VCDEWALKKHETRVLRRYSGGSYARYLELRAERMVAEGNTVAAAKVRLWVLPLKMHANAHTSLDTSPQRVGVDGTTTESTTSEE